MKNILEKYYTSAELKYSVDVLKIVECDIREYLNDPYDASINYAGRGDSRSFSLTEWLVPELDCNEVFYVHDRMYDLISLGITGYTKEFADLLMKNLMECAGYDILDDIYYEAVKNWG